MHSCIAALSQSVPTLAIAYSDKTAGVFETAGAGGQVVDARKSTSSQIVVRLEATLEMQDRIRGQNETELVKVKDRLKAQVESIAATVRHMSAGKEFG